MGKHSGRNALSTRLQQLGFDLSTQEVDDVFKRFKALADKKKGITDDDLLALVGDEVHQPAEIWKLIDLQVRKGGPMQGMLSSWVGGSASALSAMQTWHAGGRWLAPANLVVYSYSTRTKVETLESRDGTRERTTGVDGV